MGLKIERKFLVRQEVWQHIEKPQGKLYRQGYLSTDPQKTIRVRLAETEAYLTIKGITVGMVRPEYEYAIPPQDAADLLDHFTVSELSKVRYRIPFAGKVWEVDEFLGENRGLIVAEIELETESEAITLPYWVAEEVTNDARYYNANLSTVPYQQWD